MSFTHGCVLLSGQTVIKLLQQNFNHSFWCCRFACATYIPVYSVLLPYIKWLSQYICCVADSTQVLTFSSTSVVILTVKKYPVITKYSFWSNSELCSLSANKPWEKYQFITFVYFVFFYMLYALNQTFYRLENDVQV